MPPHDEFERSLVGQGFRHVAGVDEAGRGPLAGPVSAAAVILDLDNLPDGIDDSKALSPEQRETACSAILGQAVAVGIGFASAAEIDRINIRQATFVAMRRAVGALSAAPHHLLIDGKDGPPACPCPIRMVIGGDALSLSIAAASIVAKVMRDRLMVRLACGASRLRVCDPQGLCHGGSSGRDPAPWPVAFSPIELLFGFVSHRQRRCGRMRVDPAFSVKR